MVRVMIERRISQGMEEAFRRALREMRREAIHSPGYISGESLRNAKDEHHYVVLSTWNSFEAWQAWKASEPRRKVLAKIEPMLAETERITVLEPV